ncbi:MAG: AAA family ATPase [Pseudomonadota bacterium]
MTQSSKTIEFTTAQSNQTQDEVFRFLSQPSSYLPTIVDQVEIRETHGAMVFLAGDCAYKLKRSVRLAYLDFSTLALREKACRHEIERNATFSSDIYLGVSPIVRLANGGLQIGTSQPGSEVIDWVVVMKRFDDSLLLDKLAQERTLPVSLMPALAETVADSHTKAPVRKNHHGEVALDAVVAQIIQSHQAAPSLLGPDQVDRFAGRIRHALSDVSALLEERSRSGSVRLCHGDLHLRNLVLIAGRPTLFDAIEFDDEISTVDVLYDLAFLLMDLWHRGLKAHANLCFNTYASQAMSSKQLSGLQALPLFMAARAGIRGMVAIDRLKVCPACERKAVLREIEQYFELASSVLTLKKPTLAVVGGRSGTGKSTLAQGLAPGFGNAPGALHLRSDVERKRMLNVAPLDRLPLQAYSEGQNEAVYKRLVSRATVALEAGHSVIVDAVFLSQMHRDWLHQVARQNHSSFVGLWLCAPQDVMVDRVEHRKDDASDAHAGVVRKQMSLNTDPTEWHRIDANASPEIVLSAARAALDAV